MHAGDTIDLHFHVVSQNQGWHIDVADETTGGSGTIVSTAPMAAPAGRSTRRRSATPSAGGS
jgi:hypothetical protein